MTELALCIFPRLDWLDRESFLRVDPLSCGTKVRQQGFILKRWYPLLGKLDYFEKSNACMCILTEYYSCFFALCDSCLSLFMYVVTRVLRALRSWPWNFFWLHLGQQKQTNKEIIKWFSIFPTKYYFWQHLGSFDTAFRLLCWKINHFVLWGCNFPIIH